LDVTADIKSPNGENVVATGATAYEAVGLMEKWLEDNDLYTKPKKRKNKQ